MTTYAWQQPPIPRTASGGRRVAAFTIDLVIAFMLAWLAAFIAASTGLLVIPDALAWGKMSQAFGLLAIVGIFEAPILLLYMTLFEARGGRTPGKGLIGLRVRRADDKPITLGEAFLRNLLRILWITPFAPAFILLDTWALTATELDQRIGDLAAGTIVVDERYLV